MRSCRPAKLSGNFPARDKDGIPWRVVVSMLPCRMKTKNILVTPLFFAAALLLAADRVDTSQLPAAIRKSLDASSNGGTVKKITVHNVNGQTVYDFELERENAPNPRLRIAEDGRVLRESSARNVEVAPLYPEYGGVLATESPKLKLSEVPASVQKTIGKEMGGREIAAIERTQWNGQPAYRVSLREGGRNPEFYVADDGTLLKPKEKPPGVGTLFVGTRFEDTPPAVQQTIRREAGEKGEIVNIDRKGGKGESTTSYKIDLKDARGAYQIHVAEGGQILDSTRTNRN